MKLIEHYEHKEAGYNPFLIREGWQVAQLKYVEGQGMEDIQKIDLHSLTDEVFVLIEGTAVLIAAEKKESEITYEMISMIKGIVYNIPRGVWHNIAMSRDARIIIIEKDNTHLGDCDYYYLDKTQKEELYQQVAAVLSR